MNRVWQSRQSTSSPKGIVQFWSCYKAVAHKAEPFYTSRTGQYLLDCKYVLVDSWTILDQTKKTGIVFLDHVVVTGNSFQQGPK